MRASRPGSSRSRSRRSAGSGVAWTKGLGGQLNAIPTVVNDTVVVATGTGHLRVYAAATGRLIANRELRGAAFAAPIAIGRDVAVVTWTRKLMVFRLPPPKK